MKNISKPNLPTLLFLIAFLEMALVISFAGYKLYCLAKYTSILRVKTIELQNRTEIADTVNILNDEKKKLEGQLIDEKRYFFTDAALLQFLKDLEPKAGNYGISVNSISFGNLVSVSESLKDLKTLSISFSMTGSYNGIVRFVESIENSRPIAKPNQISFSLSNVKSPEGPGMINTSILFPVETRSSDKWFFQGE